MDCLPCRRAQSPRHSPQSDHKSYSFLPFYPFLMHLHFVVMRNLKGAPSPQFLLVDTLNMKATLCPHMHTLTEKRLRACLGGKKGRYNAPRTNTRGSHNSPYTTRLPPAAKRTTVRHLEAMYIPTAINGRQMSAFLRT